jgi:hypothetical protein
MNHSEHFSEQLVRSKVGRIVLHLICVSRDRQFRWHWQGIRNEFNN